MPSYVVSTDVNFLDSKYGGVVFIKRVSQIASSADKPFQSQLRYFVFSEGQPFAGLYSFVQHFVSPFFNSAIQAQHADNKMGIKGAKKALADMETSLSTLSQDTDIPEVNLAFHPLIRAAVAKAVEAGRDVTLADAQQCVDDPAVIKLLDRGVVRWVREIQKVTLLDRDPSTGTTEKELTFWTDLEVRKQACKHYAQNHAETLCLVLVA